MKKDKDKTINDVRESSLKNSENDKWESSLKNSENDKSENSLNNSCGISSDCDKTQNGHNDGSKCPLGGNKGILGKLFTQKRNFLFVLPVLAVIMYFLAKSNRDIAEKVFARGIYRVYGEIFSRISDILPFSLAELLITLFIIFVPTMLILGVVRIIRVKVNRASVRIFRLLSMFRDILLTIGILLFWFMIGCGTNYYRYEFTEYSGLTVENATVEELAGLYRELLTKTVEARRATGASETAVFSSKMSFSERADAASDAMSRIGELYDVLDRYYPDPKPVAGSWFMSYFGISGVYSPFTVEANVNFCVPDYTKGFDMCHELSHLSGFMREDEANYLGYLACINSDNPELIYSGYSAALVHVGNKLYEADPDLYFSIRELYPKGLNADLAANNEFWTQFRKTEVGAALSNAGKNINNAYLKANGVSDGTSSYGRFADLLLAEYRQRGKKQ